MDRHAEWTDTRERGGGGVIVGGGGGVDRGGRTDREVG